MDKIEFMNRLKKGLDDFPREEQENALKYYVEYFQEAGDDKEEEVMRELGDPDKIIADIRENYDGKLVSKPKSRIEPWIIVLLVLASPFLFAGGLVIFSLLLSAWIVIVSFGLVAVVTIICGLFIAIVSFLSIPSSIPTFIFMLGVGMFMGAIGIFLLEFTCFCSKKLVEGINYMVLTVWNRGEKNA